MHVVLVRAQEGALLRDLLPCCDRDRDREEIASCFFKMWFLTAAAALSLAIPPPAVVSFTCGGLAGALGAATVYPLDYAKTLMQTEEESPASPGDMSDARPVMKRGADSALDIELEGIMGRLGNLQHSDANEQITKFVEVIGCSHDEAKASPFAPPGLD